MLTCVYTLGIAQLSDIQTCVSKDLRPGFEGHDVVEISWKLHGMHIHTYMCYRIAFICYI